MIVTKFVISLITVTLKVVENKDVTKIIKFIFYILFSVFIQSLFIIIIAFFQLFYHLFYLLFDGLNLHIFLAILVFKFLF